MSHPTDREIKLARLRKEKAAKRDKIALTALIIFVAVFIFGVSAWVASFLKPWGLHKKATIAHKQGEVYKAIGMYKKILRDHPEYAVVHFELGTAYVDVGNFKKAEQQRLTLLEISQKSLAATLENLIWVAKAAGKGSGLK